MLSTFDPSHRPAAENEQSSISGDYLRTQGLSELDVAIMKARDLMTSEVVSASPETPVRYIAALLSAHGISAVPVIDETGTVVGMVSEGDLIGHR
jgi:CBS domain-containing protein